MLLKGRVAVVTGAGRGIGKAIALGLAREGADIVAVSRTPSDIEQTAEQILELGRRAVPFSADVSNPEDVTKLVRHVLRGFHTIDVLVNNAAILGPIGPMHCNDTEHWIRTIGVNLTGVFLCSREVLPVMIQNRRGKIINLSGGGAVYARPRFTAYSASKAAVVRLTESLGEEVREFNIQVNAIAPGAVRTRMWDDVSAAGELAGEEALTELVQFSGKDDRDAPRKAVALAVFLASQESDRITGKLLAAQHDDWLRISKTEGIHPSAYTMRRIDSYTLRQLNAQWDLDALGEGN